MGTRLVIQIPCYNEAENLGDVLAELPREIPGCDEVFVVVVDDGSDDGTADIAVAGGADYVMRHPRRRGYLGAFTTALRSSLALGADVVINTDGDHQYPGRFISDVVAPVISGRAELVIGDRQPGKSPHFSPLKRFFQRFGSWAVGRLAGFEVHDAVSGFRAWSRDAALKMQTFTGFSHTVESLIRFGKMGLPVLFVPIDTNATPRPSRLQRNMWHYIWQQAKSLTRAYALYEPLKTFTWLGSPFLLAGAALETRFLYLYLTGQGGVGRYIHSVTIGGALLSMGLILWALGLLSDALLCNRRLSEEVLFQLRRSPDALKAEWDELQRLVYAPADKPAEPDADTGS